MSSYDVTARLNPSFPKNENGPAHRNIVGVALGNTVKTYG